MDDMSLKKKIIEWLQLRKAVETLEKAGIHDQHSMAPQGQSVAGHDYRVGKQIQQEGHPDHLGFLKAALDSHKRKLDVLKQQPKPNLPKTEKAEVIPADVSAPVIQNRVDMNGPKIIDQPNIVNPYKEIFGALKNKKGE